MKQTKINQVKRKYLLAAVVVIAVVIAMTAASYVIIRAFFPKAPTTTLTSLSGDSIEIADAPIIARARSDTQSLFSSGQLQYEVDSAASKQLTRDMQALRGGSDCSTTPGTITKRQGGVSDGATIEAALLARCKATEDFVVTTTYTSGYTNTTNLNGYKLSKIDIYSDSEVALARLSAATSTKLSVRIAQSHKAGEAAKPSRSVDVEIGFFDQKMKSGYFGVDCSEITPPHYAAELQFGDKQTVDVTVFGADAAIKCSGS